MLLTIEYTILISLELFGFFLGLFIDSSSSKFTKTQRDYNCHQVQRKSQRNISQQIHIQKNNSHNIFKQVIQQIQK